MLKEKDPLSFKICYLAFRSF